MVLINSSLVSIPPNQIPPNRGCLTTSKNHNKNDDPGGFPKKKKKTAKLLFNPNTLVGNCIRNSHT